MEVMGSAEAAEKLSSRSLETRVAGRQVQVQRFRKRTIGGSSGRCKQQIQRCPHVSSQIAWRRNDGNDGKRVSGTREGKTEDLELVIHFVLTRRFS